MIRIKRVGDKTYLYDWDEKLQMWIQRVLVIRGDFDMELKIK